MLIIIFVILNAIYYIILVLYVMHAILQGVGKTCFAPSRGLDE